jgi:predicted acyltransferase
MSLASNRLISLDAMRGFTIAAMILVNFPGNSDYVFAPLMHSLWNGLTPTDVIAPFFLFIVGVSITLAYTKRIERGDPKAEMYQKIVWRSFKIFAVGIFLNLLPDFNFADLRWTGTLPRIAIVFLFCALLFLNTRWKAQAWVGASILIAYWLAMTLIPVPIDAAIAQALVTGEILRSSGPDVVEGLRQISDGFIAPNLEPGTNLTAWFDRQYLPGSMWQVNWDPEGILSTFPSIVSGITGMLAGHIIIGKHTREEKVIWLMVAGFFAAFAGYLWGLVFPVNENIWTSSFVLVTSGMGAMLMGVVYFLVDMKGRTFGTKPGIIFGANAITVYVLGDVLAILFYYIKFGGQSLNMHFFDAFTAIGIAPKIVSMLYALLYVCIIYIPAYVLYRKRIFIKL